MDVVYCVAFGCNAIRCCCPTHRIQLRKWLASVKKGKAGFWRTVTEPEAWAACFDRRHDVDGSNCDLSARGATITISITKDALPTLFTIIDTSTRRVGGLLRLTVPWQWAVAVGVDVDVVTDTQTQTQCQLYDYRTTTFHLRWVHRIGVQKASQSLRFVNINLLPCQA